MNKKDYLEITIKLIDTYPNAKCSLNFSTPFEMLVAVCLSAQCTDAKVNKVTKELFKKYNTPNDFASANQDDIKELIKPCGFQENKSKNLINAGKYIIENYNGIVPDTIEELIEIPGVGRKSANVIMNDAFENAQGIAVDTHVKRISQRIGFSKESDPLKIEQDLLKNIPQEYWHRVNHVFINHGRDICSSQKPKCIECPVKDLCLYNKKKKIEPKTKNKKNKNKRS